MATAACVQLVEFGRRIVLCQTSTFNRNTWDVILGVERNDDSTIGNGDLSPDVTLRVRSTSCLIRHGRATDLKK